MRKLIHKKWLSIPVTVFLVLVLTTGAVFASGAYITTDQTVTQTVEYDYGTITAPTIELANVKVGESITEIYMEAVVVDLGSSGVGKEFRMSATPSPLYTSFDVTITLVDRPDGSEVGLYGYSISGGGLVGIQLDVEGTYTFEQTISVTAGNEAGTATSTINFTLEEYTGPPPPP